MPGTWRPPKSKGKVISLDLELEDIEEIDKIMRIPSRKLVSK